MALGYAANDTLNEHLWLIQDTNFNSTALVDVNGNVVERYVCDPFGQGMILDAG